MAITEAANGVLGFEKSAVDYLATPIRAALGAASGAASGARNANRLDQAQRRALIDEYGLPEDTDLMWQAAGRGAFGGVLGSFAGALPGTALAGYGMWKNRPRVATTGAISAYIGAMLGGDVGGHMYSNMYSPANAEKIIAAKQKLLAEASASAQA